MLNVAIIGPGLVGAEFVRQVRQYMSPKGAATSDNNNGVFPMLQVVAIANSSKMLLGSSGIPLDRWQDFLGARAPAASAASAAAAAPTSPLPAGMALSAVDFDVMATHLKQLASPALVVDCTSNDFVAGRYPQWLRAGFHIVTPNKKAFSGDLGLWRDIVKLTARKPGIPPYPLCYHEATVGECVRFANNFRSDNRCGM